MYKILGIDTGGTYTDGVIIASDTKQVLCKAKTLTTRRDLCICIKNCISTFTAEDLAGISLVCLSTTLATNAIVEGRGCKEGLILIGGRPEGKLPTDRYRVIKGKLDIQGRLKENLDYDELDSAIEFFRGKVDALAVSGYASVRNPVHEMQVKEFIRHKLGIPVACAHELTTSLGFYDRTVTVDLNAQLIPLICNLIDSVTATLKSFHIHAPLMVVKGDGTLMTEHCARESPIETILSGPAASVIGGRFLSGKDDAIILDMGGTTTDIANINSGILPISNEGAKVSGWLTRIRAIEIYTVGLGGDSRIYLDSKRNICVGPRKVIPYCRATTWFPALLDELQSIYRNPDCEHQSFWRNEQEAFMVTKYCDYSERSEPERRVLAELQNMPHTCYYLQTKLRIRNLLSILEQLITENMLTRIALTPTDLLHTGGDYVAWNQTGSILALQILSEQLSLPLEQCKQQAYGAVYSALSRACIQSCFYYDCESFDMDSSEVANYFVNRIFLQDTGNVLGCNLYLKKPIVAIGAPIASWSKKLSETLHTEVIVPHHAAVANAIGAAVAQIIERNDILIRLDPISKKYTVFSAENRCSFSTLEEATEYAKASGRRLAASHLPGIGSAFDLIDDTFITDSLSGEKRFIERRVTVTAFSGEIQSINEVNL
ncbi:MAG: hydantoinase/oxoprolinase family protein [Clostridiaceae bacterium]|nr:hydantoinase/oxoprolinase family protein [Clostridiaceae bacterium]